MSPPLLAGWDCHAHVFDERPSMHVGHYHPPPRAIETLEGQAADVGIGRVVLVQPERLAHRRGVEAVYRGVMAPLARPGHLSHLERPNYDFCRYLARRLTNTTASG